jgi:hypothetical protein
MALDGNGRRRILGALVLLAALGMLIAGETVLKGRLQNFGFLIYWLVCFLFTGAAFIIAFQDVRALRHRLREEQRDLLHSTLEKIEKEARQRPPRQRGGLGPPSARPGRNGHSPGSDGEPAGQR